MARRGRCRRDDRRGMSSAAQVPSPPRLLADVLRGRSEWRLLDPATDLAGDYTIAQLEALDCWPPWIELDFDRDGLDDIAAVVGAPRRRERARVHRRRRARRDAGPRRAGGAVPRAADLRRVRRHQGRHGDAAALRRLRRQRLVSLERPRLRAVAARRRRVDPDRRRARPAFDPLRHPACRRHPDRRRPVLRPGAGAGGRRRGRPALVPRGSGRADVPAGLGAAAARDGRRGSEGSAAWPPHDGP